MTFSEVARAESEDVRRRGGGMVVFVECGEQKREEGFASDVVLVFVVRTISCPTRTPLVVPARSPFTESTPRRFARLESAHRTWYDDVECVYVCDGVRDFVWDCVW